MSDVNAVLSAVHAGTAGPAELYAALAAAPLLLAVASGRGESALPLIVRVEGVDHGIVCTDRGIADQLADVPVFAEMGGRDLGARWPAGLRALLNPGTDTALVLDADAMHAIGRTQETLDAGTAYAVGAPAESPPAALVEAVRGALRNVGGATEAYLFQFVPAGGVSRLVCGLVLPPGGDPRTVIPPIASAVAHQDPAAGTLDFTPLSGAMLESVAGYVPAIR